MSCASATGTRRARSPTCAPSCHARLRWRARARSTRIRVDVPVPRPSAASWRRLRMGSSAPAARAASLRAGWLWARAAAPAGAPCPAQPRAAEPFRAPASAGRRRARRVGRGHRALRPAELSDGVRRAARLAAGAACCALLIASVLGAFPFWPPGLALPFALAGAMLALASPWLACAFTLAVCVPALGNVSAGLAWCVAIGGIVWLAACVRAGRRALLPAAAPLLAALGLWPLYVVAAGTMRSLPGRALAGAAGPIAIALWAAVPAGRRADGERRCGRGRPRPDRRGRRTAAPAVRCVGARRGRPSLHPRLGSAGHAPRRVARCVARRPGSPARTRGRRSGAGRALGRGDLGRGYTSGAGRTCAR